MENMENLSSSKLPENLKSELKRLRDLNENVKVCRNGDPKIIEGGWFISYHDPVLVGGDWMIKVRKAEEAGSVATRLSQKQVKIVDLISWNS